MNNLFQRKRTRSQISNTLINTNKQGIRFRKVSSNLDDRRQNQSIRKMSYSKEDFRPKTQSLKNFTYNKWYIRPQNRMKKSVAEIKLDKTHDQFYYRYLFKTQYQDPQCPFNVISNDKMKLLQKIPKNNLSCIEIFRKNQIAKRKRVPKIIDMLIRQQQELKLKVVRRENTQS